MLHVNVVLFVVLMDSKFLFSLFPYKKKQYLIKIEFFVDGKRLKSEQYLITQNDRKEGACTDVLFSFEENKFDKIDFRENSLFTFALYHYAEISEEKGHYLRSFNFSAREVRCAKNKGEYKKLFRFQLGDARFESEVPNLRALCAGKGVSLFYNDIGVVLSFREGVRTFIPRDGSDDVIDFSIETEREIAFKREVNDFKEFLPEDYMCFGFVCGHRQRPFIHFVPRTNLDDPKSTKKMAFFSEKLLPSSDSPLGSSLRDFLSRIINVDIASGLFFVPWKVFYEQQVAAEPHWLDECFVPGDLDRSMLRLGHHCFKSTKNAFYGIAVFSKGDFFGTGICFLRSNGEINGLIKKCETHVWGEIRRHEGGAKIILMKDSLHLLCETYLEKHIKTDRVCLYSFYFYYEGRDHVLFFSREFKPYLSLSKLAVSRRLPRYQIHILADDVTETTVRYFTSSALHDIRDEPFSEMMFYNPLPRGRDFLNIEIEGIFSSKYVFEICKKREQQQELFQAIPNQRRKTLCL